jgi:hypothetical protein
MKKIILNIVLLVNLTTNTFAQGGGAFSFFVRDSETGYGVNASIELKHDGKTKKINTDNGGHCILNEPIGYYDLLINSGGYSELKTYFTLMEKETINVEILLDKKNKLPVLYEKLNYAIIQGFVIDYKTGKAMKDVVVSMDDNHKTITNEKGYFSFISNEYSNMNTVEEKPIRKSVTFSKDGYGTYVIENLFIAPTVITVKADMKEGSGYESKKEFQHILDGTTEDTKLYELTNKSIIDGSNNITIQKNLSVCSIPTSIRVGTGCSCTNCSNVSVMTLQYYSESGIDDEWIPSWGFASLAAGSVPYRSYGGWYVNNPVTTNFDIASSTCNQVWGSTVYASTQSAAIATNGSILTANGINPVRSEYSAENNYGGQAYNCNDCNAGGSGGYSCYNDNLCCGESPAGHGRGMCQWGSSRWATNGQTYQWIINKYFQATVGYSICQPVPPDNTPPSSVASVANPTSYKTSNFTVSFADADNTGGSGLDRSFYSVLDWDGTEWRANNNKGFLCDNFDAAIHPEWTSTAGTWAVSSNVLNQINNANTNTALNINLNQSLSNRYIYHWAGNIGGTGTNRNAGIHIMCSSVNNVNRGNNYLVWFKADAAEVHIYEVVNDVISSPLKVFTNVTINTGSWYDYKVMYDRVTGKFTIWMNNNLIGEYIDATPLSTGTGFSFRTSNCTYSVNDLKVYRSRLVNSASISIGNASADVRFQSPNPSNVSYSCKIKTLCIDNASNISTIGNLDLLIDWTAPSAPVTVNDGTSSDISITSSINTLNANFTGCADANSGIKNYYYFIGTAVNDSSLLGATNNTLNTSITKSGLNLINGTTYYISVYSLNNAGLKSTVTSSNGQMVNIATGLYDMQKNTDFNIFPNPNNGTFAVRINNDNKSNTLLITNLLGEIIDQKEVNTTIFNYETPIAKGVYFVTLLNSNKQNLGTIKIIVL